MALVAFPRPTLAQAPTGAVVGRVVDVSGGAVEGANVLLTDVRRGRAHTAITIPGGHFTFTHLEPSNYEIRVTADGFKPIVPDAFAVGPGDRVSLGDLELAPGGYAEVVYVTRSSPLLDAGGGDRAHTIEGGALDALGVNSRSYLALVPLVPGVVSTANLTIAGHAGLGAISANGGRANTNNLTIDGIGNVDTGNNADQLATLSLDAIGEVKVLTASYPAEYGRASGAQVVVVTKSGTQKFSGSGYWFRRHDSLNANNWMNNRDGLPRPLMRLDDVGYTVGGPIVVPGRFNEDRTRLFFFVSQEFQTQRRPQSTRRVKVPTALERRGDFSRSVDLNGAPFPFIRDWMTGLPCRADDTRGCFQHEGVVGRIPPDRLYGPGLAVLGLYPDPNAEGQGFNLVSQVSDDYPRREDLFRLDWQPGSSWRVSGHFIDNDDETRSAYGSFVLGTNVPIGTVVDARPGSHLAVTVSRVLTSNSVIEVSAGYGYNEIVIEPVDDSAFRKAGALAGFPLLYPSAAQGNYLPSFAFGTRIGTAPTAGTSNAPFFNDNRATELAASVTRTWATHTVKGGLFVQRSRKDQTSFAPANGSVDFGESTSNPFDTGYGYANAAIGAFTSFQQASQYAVGRYRYRNVEWYVQDNWRVRPRLTLDVGARFYWIEPQYEDGSQTSNFAPALFDPSRAPRLFQPAFDAGGERVGYDPVTGQTVSALFIGRIVPGSGDPLNGIVRAGDPGVPRGFTKSGGIRVAPRVGMAWDVDGAQRLVIRGGGGVFYDRIQGNDVFDLLTNPPTTFAPQLQNGLLESLASGVQLLAPSSLHARSTGGQVPTVYTYNLGFQVGLPAAMALDASYVGAQTRHLLQRRNINAVPYGAAFAPANQDPTRSSSLPGGASLPADFLRPYRGYGNILLHETGANANYNALQVAARRRFRAGLALGAAYTWSKALGTGELDSSPARIDGLNREANYGLLGYSRAHTLTGHVVYAVPNPFRDREVPRWVARSLDGWQVSGLHRYVSGQPYTPAVVISGSGTQNVTGSFTEGYRIGVIRDPGPGHASDPYRQFDQDAFVAPVVGSLGLESGRNWLIGPPTNTLDLSLQKSIELTGQVRVQLRVDAFNVFNHTQFSGVNATLVVKSLDAPVPQNLPFDSAGRLINATGFGTVSGARDARVVQLVARVVF